MEAEPTGQKSASEPVTAAKKDVYTTSSLSEHGEENRHREVVCNILEEAISPAVTTLSDYTVRDRLKAIPTLGSWGFHVRAYDYCCAQFEGNDQQPFYIRKMVETRNALALYDFLKEQGTNPDSFGRVYLFKTKLDAFKKPNDDVLQEKFPLGLILLCHELGIQIHDMTWFTEGNRFDEFALPSTSRLKAQSVRADTDTTMYPTSIKRPIMFDFEGCPQMHVFNGKNGIEMMDSDQSQNQSNHGLRIKSRVYFLSNPARSTGRGNKWIVIIYIQTTSLNTMQWEHPSILNFRTVPDFLSLQIQRKSPDDICAVFDDKYQVFKHFHRALIGGDLRVLAVISALLDDIFNRLGSGKTYPARNVRKQDLYSSLSRLRACRKVLEKRLADIRSIPSPPERVKKEHEDWREVAAQDVEFAIAKTAELERMAHSTIGLLYNIVTIHESQSVLWLTKMAFLFLPMTFVATIFGMNIRELIQTPPGVGVYLITAVSVMIATLLLTAGPVRVYRDAREWLTEFWEGLPIVVFEARPKLRIYIERSEEMGPS